MIPRTAKMKKLTMKHCDMCRTPSSCTAHESCNYAEILTCSRPSVVYVVATGKMRVAIESEIHLTLENVSAMAIERFVKMGCPSLGQIMEITECSDHADASDPHYVSTHSMLEKAGRVHIAPLSDENA